MLLIPPSVVAKPLPPPKQIKISYISQSERISSIFSSLEVDFIRVRTLFNFIFLPFFYYRTIHFHVFPRISAPSLFLRYHLSLALPWHPNQSVVSTSTSSKSASTEYVEIRSFNQLQALLEATIRQLDEERNARIALETKIETLFSLLNRSTKSCKLPCTC